MKLTNSLQMLYASIFKMEGRSQIQDTYTLLHTNAHSFHKDLQP